MGVTVALGRLGLVAPLSMVGQPMDPSLLCDLLAAGLDAVAFFAPELAGQPDADAAANALAERGFASLVDQLAIAAT
jgi:hypothetical protein